MMKSYSFGLHMGDMALLVNRPSVAGADPARIQKGGFVHSEGGVSYSNFRSGSKLLQGPGQINKPKKIADSRRGGGSDHQKNPHVSAHVWDCCHH